jgi:predicted transcriptional regulator
MAPEERIAPEARIAFRDQLRDARAQAINDAEAYDELLFAFERLGSFLTGKIASLGKYGGRILELARRSPLAEDFSAEQRECHVPADQLFEQVREARNDALHYGAFARRLTAHAIQLGIVLEDALMAPATVAADLMVRNPVCACLWQPVSYVRQQMLANSFSYLPVLSSGEWCLVSDLSVAKYLREAQTPAEKKRRLATPLRTAIAEGLELETAECFYADTPVTDIVQRINHHPALVCRKEETELVGILTAFDLL